MRDVRFILCKYNVESQYICNNTALTRRTVTQSRAGSRAQTERCQYLSLLATNLDNTLQVLRRFLYLHQPGSANGLLRFRDMRERERESELL